MSTPCLALFTSRSSKRILQEGGSGDWVLDATRAIRCRYAICIRNLEGAHLEDRETGERYVPHRAAFLVGEIVDVVPFDRQVQPPRWLVKFGRYADVMVDGLWDGRRNPVGYLTMEDLGIDPTLLDFQAMPQQAREKPARDDADFHAEAAQDLRPLTLAQAKAGLALYLGVDESAIEIIVRA